VDIGLGIPREPVRLVVEGDTTRCVGTKTKTLDVTEKLVASAEQQKSWQSEIFGYILKKDSPSCGMERVKLYRNNQVERSGVGIYANKMMQNFPNLPVEEEGGLGDPLLRENFIQRVFIYQRWNQLLACGLSWSGLTEFHARHKLILFSHDQDMARELGRNLSESAALDILVLQHIQGYLKKHLDSDDKRELSDSIEQYRLGLLPLIVPITLLRHHFIKYPDDYIEHSYYMRPYPNELMLLNSL
jgi:uncharacterized protein YbgA (DUF1722 family)